jgi:hypothetical protein
LRVGLSAVIGRHRLPLAALAAATFVLGVAAATIFGGDEPAAREAAPAAPSRCGARIDRGMLPTWARTGFSAPRPRMPHVVGRHGRIAAILFGDPLTAPPRRDVGNKILWVSKAPAEPLADLGIRARLLPRGTTVRRVVEGGPGPSIVDLPKAGCWRLSLRWGKQSDELDLTYAARG